jgi:hypothetical protein
MLFLGGQLTALFCSERSAAVPPGRDQEEPQEFRQVDRDQSRATFGIRVPDGPDVGGIEQRGPRSRRRLSGPRQ